MRENYNSVEQIMKMGRKLYKCGEKYKTVEEIVYKCGDNAKSVDKIIWNKVAGLNHRRLFDKQ